MKRFCGICHKEFIVDKSKGNSGLVCVKCRQLYRVRTLKARAVEYKGGKCQKCGYDKCIEALEFHHRDPSQKEFTISGSYNISWNKIQQELDKCDILCANCHREEHSKNTVPISEYEKYIIPQRVRNENAKKKKKQSDVIKQTRKKKYKEILRKNNINDEVMKHIRLDRRKVKRPTKEQFFKEYNELKCNKSAMGRKYGVSSKAIEKWIKSYEKYGI